MSGTELAYVLYCPTRVLRSVHTGLAYATTGHAVLSARTGYQGGEAGTGHGRSCPGMLLRYAPTVYTSRIKA
eukprot:3940793-Rhodomonas_salina.2